MCLPYPTYKSPWKKATNFPGCLGKRCGFWLRESPGGESLSKCTRPYIEDLNELNDHFTMYNNPPEPVSEATKRGRLRPC